MDKIKILWADDEIELLKPHILFLEGKGYEVLTARSGDEAVDVVKENNGLSAVLLDENMPGISGLDALLKIKQVNNELPVIMITKSEEEHIMDDAIGGKIADYLIKPVNPSQILLALKKALDNRRLVSEKTNTDYRKEFGNIGMSINSHPNWEEWTEIYKKIIYWELEMDQLQDKSMLEVLHMQKSDANNQFFKFIEKNYISWLNGKSPNPPTMSHTLIKNKFLKELDSEETVFFVLIDNLRYDQWKIIQSMLQEYYRTESEETYFSILPTATQYARNAIFSGLMPGEIAKRYPDKWLDDEEEGGKNLNEEFFMQAQMKRLGKDIKMSYTKITNYQAGKKLADNISNLLQNKLNVIVYNFVDMLSHARTEMEVIRELAENEAAYRGITYSWFEHSPLFEILKQLSSKKIKLVITTDHGTVHVKEPTKILGDRNVNTNLRYKQGKALDYNPKEVFEVKNPADAYLPVQHPSSRFVFAREDRFFAYPNNFNHYVSYYKNTFQHGGVSLEEVIIPYIVLHSK